MIRGCGSCDTHVRAEASRPTRKLTGTYVALQNRQKKMSKRSADYEYDYDLVGDPDDVADDTYDPNDRGKKKAKKNNRINKRNVKSAIAKSKAIANEYDDEDDDAELEASCLDYTGLKIKADHQKRPIWVAPNNIIVLEAYSEFYDKAYDFVIDIAEPETRPEFIHTYRLTRDSLFASSITKTTDFIIKHLNIFCKTELPSEVVQYIQDCTQTFGKAKLVLKDNTFYVESQYPEVLRELLRNPTIKDAHSRALTEDTIHSTATSNTAGTTDEVVAAGTEFLLSSVQEEDQRNLMPNIGIDDDTDSADDEDVVDDELHSDAVVVSAAPIIKVKTVHSFKVARSRVQLVKKCAKEESFYPLLEEYDFKVDNKNPKLLMDLKPITAIRPYQERSLNKMFGNGRARSGIIVLPCGAGKSLTGVVAATTIKRSVVIMCINNTSVNQWKEEFKRWTTINEDCIKKFTSENKNREDRELPPKTKACIVITTYAMLCYGGRRSETAEIMLQSIKSREWGLIILDEVHVAPAEKFSRVLELVNAHCKLGLTATLVREDEKIKDLHFLVGPKLYEANWIDLTNQGYLAKAQCVEVWCPMTKHFYAEYINLGAESHSRIQQMLYLLNPSKIRACEYLVQEHLKRGHKIIIFCDDVMVLKIYCEAYKQIGIDVPYIYGGTKEDERRAYLGLFKDTQYCNIIGLSKVGDTALDIPEANVVLQISSHFGSKRQEAQRLGRILRPKPNPSGGFNAFFYSLVSTDTKEMYYAMKRQQYLIDQGYTFKIEQKLADFADETSKLLPLHDKVPEVRLLNNILHYDRRELAEYDEADRKAVERARTGDFDDDDDDKPPVASVAVVRRVGNMSALSGADGTMYMEYNG